MALPVQVQRFFHLAGDNQGQNVLSLSDVYSSQDSTNVYVDQYGRISKVPGYTALNASAITTDTGASAVAVTSIIEYQQVGGTPQVLLVVDDQTDEVELWKGLYPFGTAPTYVGTLASGTAANQVRYPCDFAQWGSDMFITITNYDTTGGTTATPKVFDGSSLSTAGGTQTSTPTLTASATAGDPSGTYECKVMAVEGKTRQLASATSGEVALDSKQGSVAWAQSSDSGVTGYEVYFTTGTGKAFYFADYVDGKTSNTYTYDKTDEELLWGRRLDEDGDAPPSARYVEAHRGRMFWAYGDNNQQRVWWSNPGDPDGVGANSYLDCSGRGDEADKITGMTGEYLGQLIIWQEQSVWALAGTGVLGATNIFDFTVRRTNASIGTVHHRSVVKVPAGAKFTDEMGQIQTTAAAALAYYTPANHIHILMPDASGTLSDRQISYPRDQYLSSVNYQARMRIHAQHDRKRGIITWYVPRGSNQWSCNVGLAWNYHVGTWSVLSSRPFASSCSISHGGIIAYGFQRLLAGEALTSTGGYVYENWTGNDLNGSAFISDWWTRPIYGMGQDGPLLHKTKRWRHVDVVMGAQSSTHNATVEWYDAFASQSLSPTAVGSGTVALLSSTDSHVQEKIEMKDSSGDYLESQVMRLRVADNSASSAWTLNGFTVGYQEFPGVRP